jgi:uncharacterized protein (DUF362 family)
MRSASATQHVCTTWPLVVSSSISFILKLIGNSAGIEKGSYTQIEAGWEDTGLEEAKKESCRQKTAIALDESLTDGDDSEHEHATAEEKMRFDLFKLQQGLSEYIPSSRRNGKLANAFDGSSKMM